MPEGIGGEGIGYILLGIFNPAGYIFENPAGIILRKYVEFEGLSNYRCRKVRQQSED